MNWQLNTEEVTKLLFSAGVDHPILDICEQRLKIYPDARPEAYFHWYSFGHPSYEDNFGSNGTRVRITLSRDSKRNPPFTFWSKIIFNIIHCIARGRLPCTINGGDKPLMKDLIIAFRGAFLYLDIFVIVCDFVNDKPGFVDVSWGSKSAKSSNAILCNGDSIAFRELEMLPTWVH